MSTLRTAVIGLGLIGGSVLRRLGAEHGFSAVGYDERRASRQQAKRAGHDIASDVDEAIDGADLVVVATPPQAVAGLVRQALSAGAGAVTDCAPVKAPIAEQLADLPADQLGRYIGGHPLAGSERTGWRASSAKLLVGCSWAVTATDPQLEAFLTVARMLATFEARIVACEP